VNETAARHPNRFLADLTQAMRSTAETARQATIDQCQADAKGYVEKLHARTDDEAASLRKAAEADVSAIRDWSKAEVERIRVETEQRIARRRELLEQELQEYNSAIELEIERVQKRVSGFEEEVGQFFEQLLKEADPTIFASMAAQMPDPPSFSESERGGLATEIKARREKIMRSEDLLGVEAEAPIALPPAEPIGESAESIAARTARPAPRRRWMSLNRLRSSSSGSSAWPVSRRSSVSWAVFPGSRTSASPPARTASSYSPWATAPKRR